MTPRSDAPATPSRPRPRLRQLCAAAVVVPALALSACSGESPVTAAPSATASGGAGTSAATPSETSATTSETTSAAPTTPATTAPTTPAPTAPAKPAVPVDKPAYTNLEAVIKDGDLGHTITATRLARQLSWPAGQPVGAQQFEIVGVRVRFEAGSRYSATLEPGMLSLVAGSTTVAPTNEFNGRWQAKPLAKADRTETTSGWVFFKINRGITTPLQLRFNRPAYSVSTTGKSFPAKSFSVALTK